MNTIGFVFCILAALALGAILDLEKQLGAHRLKSSFLGNLTANREILDQTTSEFYAALKQSNSERAKEKEAEEKKQTKTPEIPPPPTINPLCSRLNLAPLIDNSPLKEPELYELAAKLFKAFYGEALFDKKPRAEYKFLDAFLGQIREQTIEKKFSLLERVSFKDQGLQMLYYKMLKGTKKNDLLNGIGYPSLLDYIKFERDPSKICLFHAHPNLLSVFFTPKGAAKLYEAMHLPKASPLTFDGIERICRDVHAPLLDLKILDLFETHQHPLSKLAKTTFIGEDTETQVFLRKVIHSPKGKEIVNELPSPR